MKRIAIYPGSFDPVTNGHLDIIERAQHLFDEVVIAISKNPNKAPTFSLPERLEFLHQAVRPYRCVRVECFSGLLAEYIRRKNAVAVIRGLRAVSDFEYEFQMALTNRKLAGDIETIFMMPHEEYSYVSSKLIKEAAMLGADLTNFIPKPCAEALKSKLKT